MTVPSPAQSAAPAPPREHSGLGIAALVCAVVVPLVGVVLGLVALVRDAKAPGRSRLLPILAVSIGAAMTLVWIAVLALLAFFAWMAREVMCGELASGCVGGGPF
ncbi:hypothetical protein [Agromyces sp. NPDC058064]|uniref:hypothetical protein n=1 Tax=Agromyces sp. NPDC058064 TaxID=3346322 RepID=UPI0036DB3ACC